MSPILMASAVAAGIASVLSPCVLPILPIVAAGSEKDHKWRPLLLSLGLALSFIAMGVISSLAGSWLASRMRMVEIFAGSLIALMGLLLLVGLDVFKHLSIFQRISQKPGTGPLSGLLLGISLGLVWIPCVGPFLSSVLTMVASQGELFQGIVLLLFYSLGFSIPVMVAGYASRWFRFKTQAVRKHALAVRIVGGLLLVSLGVFIAINGSYGLGSLSF